MKYFKFDLDGSGKQVMGYIYDEVYRMSIKDIVSLINKSESHFTDWYNSEEGFAHQVGLGLVHKPFPFGATTLFPLETALAYWLTCERDEIKKDTGGFSAYELISSMATKTLRYHFDLEYLNNIINFNDYDIYQLECPSCAEMYDKSIDKSEQE